MSVSDYRKICELPDGEELKTLSEANSALAYRIMRDMIEAQVVRAINKSVVEGYRTCRVDLRQHFQSDSSVNTHYINTLEGNGNRAHRVVDVLTKELTAKSYTVKTSTDRIMTINW